MECGIIFWEETQTGLLKCVKINRYRLKHQSLMEGMMYRFAILYLCIHQAYSAIISTVSHEHDFSAMAWIRFFFIIILIGSSFFAWKKKRVALWIIGIYSIIICIIYGITIYLFFTKSNILPWHIILFGLGYIWASVIILRFALKRKRFVQE